MSGFKYVLANGEKGDDPLKASTKTWRVEKRRHPLHRQAQRLTSTRTRASRTTWRATTGSTRSRPTLTDDEKFGGQTGGYLAHITGEHKVWPKCVEVQGGETRSTAKIFAIGGAKGVVQVLNRGPP